MHGHSKTLQSPFRGKSGGCVENKGLGMHTGQCVQQGKNCANLLLRMTAAITRGCETLVGQCELNARVLLVKFPLQ